MDEAALFGMEGCAPPADATVTRVHTRDHVHLRAACWPPHAHARAGMGRAGMGTVLVAGGRAEFIERYGETISELRDRGFHVVSFDWRGQGGSDRLVRNPHKGHVRRFDDYLHDLDAVFTDPMRKLPRPWFMLAHSMGGAIALRAAQLGRLPVDRLVALAPMVGLSLVRHTALVRRLAAVLDGLGLGRFWIPGGSARPIATLRFEGNRLTGDPQRYARNAALSAGCPHLTVGDPTVRWVHEAYRLMDRLNHPDVAPAIRLPTLVIAAGHDAIVDTRAVETFAARLRTGMPLILPGARHELLMERDAVRALFWAAFDAFVPGETGRTATALGALPDTDTATMPRA